MKTVSNSSARLRLTATFACGLLSFSACRGWETEERPIHLIKNMDTQEKGKAYRRDTTGLFADGRMMRAPVEGTVAQGQLGEDDLWEEGLDEAGEPSKAFPASVKDDWDAQVARGEGRYRIYCAPCHGPKLDGQGTVAQKALDGSPRLTVPPPDLHLERISKDMVVGKVYAAIRRGVNDGNMPSYAAQIPVADRWAIVAYVKAQQMEKDDSVPQEPGGGGQDGLGRDRRVALQGEGLQRLPLHRRHQGRGAHVQGPVGRHREDQRG